MPRTAVFVAISLLLIFCAVAAATNDGTLVRLPIKSKRVLESLTAQGIEVLSIDRDGMADVVVTEKQMGFLATLDVDISILGRPGDVSELAELDANLGLYHTFAEMQTALLNLAASYPALASLDTIATSLEGRPIYALKISDNVTTDETEPEVLIMANLHAREIMTVDICLRFAIYLLDNYTNPAIASLVDSREIYFLPMINPDGHVYVENNHIGINWWEWWRKNRRDNGDGSFGVDLNRNFGYEWGYDDIGSSPDPASNLYRGTGPFSEPETQAIRDFCASREFVIGFSYHSYGELLLYPWGYDYLYTPEHDVFLALGDTLTDENGYFAGNPAMGAIYTVNGSSDDWAYGDDTSKPPFFLFTPEVNSYAQGGFGPPDSLIQPTFDLLLPMNMRVLELADNPYRVVGPYAPTLRPADHAALSWPDFRLTWTGGDPTDPNPPLTYEVVEYKNLTTIPQDGANATSTLWRYDGFALSTARAYEGSGSYYSGATNNNSSRLETTVFHRVTADADTFSARVWYDIEVDWDYAYVEMSTDHGLTWFTIPGNVTTNTNPNYNNIGNGITGTSPGWVEAVFPLTDYIGTGVFLRWNYVTDASVLWEGIYIDLPGPVPTYESLSVVASGLSDTTLVVSPTGGAGTDNDYVYLVRAQDADGHYSIWSNPQDERVSLPTAIAGDPAFETRLDRNYPNPFNPETTIPFTVGSSGSPNATVPVALRVYNIAGQRIATLIERDLPPGSYRAKWHGTTDRGAQVPSGVYFSRLTAGARTLSQKLILLK